jgi:hypothetical protein
MAGLHEMVIGEYRLVSECDIVSKGPDVADVDLGGGARFHLDVKTKELFVEMTRPFEMKAGVMTGFSHDVLRGYKSEVNGVRVESPDGSTIYVGRNPALLKDVKKEQS